MNQRKLIYKSETSDLKYIVPIFFLLSAIIGYFYGLHYFIVGFLAFACLTTSLKDTLTIKVYNDHFEFNCTNVFGKAFAIKNTFFFSDIKNFNCNLTQWKADYKQAFIIILVELLVPGRQALKTRKKPEANLIFDIKNKLNETAHHDLTLIIENKSQKKAIDLITQTIKKT